MDIVFGLIDLHVAYRNAIYNFTHLPTMKSQIRAGSANLNVLLVCCWSGAMISQPEDRVGVNMEKLAEAAVERVFYSAKVFAEQAELASKGLAEGIAQGKSPDKALEGTNYEFPSPRAIIAVLQGVLLIRPALMNLNDPRAKQANEYVQRLFPYARFGEDPLDRYPRDPRHPPSWIAAEERCRIATLCMLTDVALAELNTTPTLWMPMDSCLSQPWLDVRVPCPDHVFESLLPSPENSEGWRQWEAMVNARGNILAEIPETPTIRQLVSWVDAQEGPDRDTVIEYGIGRMLRNGFMAMMPLFSEFWGRVIKLKRVFSANGWNYYGEAEGVTDADMSDEEVLARDERDRLVASLDDFWDALPAEVKAADAAGDGWQLMEIAQTWWGRQRRFRLAPIMIFFHAFDLVLHSPVSMPDQLRTGDLAWPRHPSFNRAQSHAMTISKLVRSLLSVPPEADLDRPDANNFVAVSRGLSREEYKKEQSKLIAPIWSLAISPAAWVHCISIRQLHLAMQSGNMDRDSARAAQSNLRTVMQDVSGCLIGMDGCGAVWKKMAESYQVMRTVVGRLSEGKEGEEVISEEELATLKASGCS